MRPASILPGLKSLVRQFFEDLSLIDLSFAARAAYNELARQFLGRRGPLRSMRIEGYPHPVWYRARGSDLKVIRQVMYHDGFDACHEISGARRVIDCGGNIGLASLVLLELWPNAKVVIVEPDADNMEMCRRNLAPYGDRVSYYQAGIWSHPCRLVVERGDYGMDEEWSFTVRPVKEGEVGDTDAIDLCTLMDREGFEVADYVKLDIEGTEEHILLPEHNHWIDRTHAFTVELHSDYGKEVLDRTMADFDCDMRDCEGHYVICKNLRRKAK